MQPTNNSEALVLWLDMLGYKNWLSQQTNIEQAEQSLLKALKIIYKTLTDEPSRLAQFDIRTTLISDTIIIYSFERHLQMWLAMNMLYHVLATELALMNLPIRGAISIGSLRVRDEEPRILLGESIVYCSSLEKSLNQFVVAVDDSVVEWLKTFPLNEDRWKYSSFLSLAKIQTKSGPKNLYVMNWMMPTVPHSLVVILRRLITRFRNNDKESVLDLMSFLPKFLNSQGMIDTVTLKDNEYYVQAVTEWTKAIHDAEEIWPEVFEQGRVELEKMTNNK